MSLRGRCLNVSDHAHAAYDVSECCKALAVGVALTTVVEFRLIPDTDKELRCRRVWTATRHGDCPIQVMQAGPAGRFHRNRREGVLQAPGVDACLNHLDLDLVIGLVVEGNGAVKDASRVKAGVDVTEKIGGG